MKWGRVPEGIPLHGITWHPKELERFLVAGQPWKSMSR